MIGVKQYLIDFTCVNPTAPSNVERSQKPGSMHQQASGRKHNKYSDMAQRQVAILVPFVMDVYGGVGKEAFKFINALLKHSAAASGPFTTTELAEWLVGRAGRGSHAAHWSPGHCRPAGQRRRSARRLSFLQATFRPISLGARHAQRDPSSRGPHRRPGKVRSCL